MPAPDERELILRAKEGGRDAFRLLVERHMKGAYDIAHHFLGDHEDAQDVAQEAFVRVHRSLGSFRGDAEFGTWLYRIVTNLSMNRIRQKKSRARDKAFDALKRLYDSVPAIIPPGLVKSRPLRIFLPLPLP